MTENQIQWVSTQQSAEFLAERAGGFPAAKSIIADALFDGRLAARANRQWRGSSMHFVDEVKARSEII